MIVIRDNYVPKQVGKLPNSSSVQKVQVYFLKLFTLSNTCYYGNEDGSMRSWLDIFLVYSRRR